LVAKLERAFSSPLATKARAGFTGPLDKEALVFEVLCQEDHPRGLEGRMSPLGLRHMRWTTSTVVRRQRETTPDALAEICRRLNQCATDLALAYGRADALLARNACDAA
jgi:hypothetical protein